MKQSIMTIDEIKKRIEVYEPIIVTEDVLDDDGNPAGETYSMGLLRAAVVIDGVDYSMTMSHSPQIYPELIPAMRDSLIQSLAHDVMEELSMP